MTITHIHWVRSGSAGDDRAIAYAGRELAGYLGKLTGTRPAVRRGWPRECAAWDRMARHLRPICTPPTGALSPAPWDDGYRDLGRGRRALHRRPERAQRVVRRLRVPGDAGRALRAAWTGGRGHPGHRRRDAAIDADRGDRALPPSRRVHRGRNLARPRPRHGRLVRQAADEHRFPAIHPQRLLLQSVVRTQIQPQTRRSRADRSRGVAIR